MEDEVIDLETVLTPEEIDPPETPVESPPQYVTAEALAPLYERLEALTEALQPRQPAPEADPEDPYADWGESDQQLARKIRADVKAEYQQLLAPMLLDHAKREVATRSGVAPEILSTALEGLHPQDATYLMSNPQFVANLGKITGTGSAPAPRSIPDTAPALGNPAPPRGIPNLVPGASAAFLRDYAAMTGLSLKEVVEVFKNN